jgi:myo-inositol-1(or 4)-monophosphatase
MDLKIITGKVCDLAIKTGDFIRDEADRFRRSDIEIKSDNNFVTYVDRKSEEMILEELHKILPEAGFIAEEDPSLQTRDLTWIVDPLDGTTNFIHGVPPFSISIGLVNKDEVILGVIYEINLRECYLPGKMNPPI